MGLDAVEMVMAVEDEFKVSISDAELFESDTVGKLVDVVYARLRHNVSDPCPSQHGFYIVRKCLIEHFGLARSELKPDSFLSDLIPEEDRPKAWYNFILNLTGDKNALATLERPRWLNRIVIILLPCIAFFLTLLWVPLSLFWLGFFPALLAIVVGNIITVPWTTCFPSAYTQVKSLVPLVETLDSRVWSREEVFEKVREISVETLRVKSEQVQLESHWVNDLGVG